MSRHTLLFSLGLALLAASRSSATELPLPGPATPGGAIAYYYTWSGEITVSVNAVDWWYIESQSDSLTGDPPMNLPGVGGLVSDSDEFIGEAGIGPFSYTNLELGAVAQPFLPDQVGLAPADLVLWADRLGTDSGNWPVVYIYVPEPSSVSLASLAFGAVVVMRRRKRT